MQLDLISHYTGVYNFNLSKTSSIFARIGKRYNISPEEYKNALFREGDLKLIQRYNLSFTNKNIEEVVSNGHLPVLIWAYKQGLDLTVKLTSIAAKYGRLDILIWAREHGCAWINLLAFER